MRDSRSTLQGPLAPEETLVRAVIQTAVGGPEVFAAAEVARPEPGPDEVLVRVAACALGQLDALQGRGLAKLPGFALPHIAGMDVSGTVEHVGPGVELATGTRVVLDPALPCGVCSRCLDGYGGYCPDVRIVGGNVDGGLAEFVVAAASQVHPIPDGGDLVEAACVPSPWATAWRSLVTVGGVSAGETVLLHAGASTVSLAAAQIAHLRGAHVIAVVSSDPKAAVLHKLGVARVLVGRDALSETVAELTAGHGVDIVLDHVGTDSWPASMDALRPEGRLVFLGNTSGDEVSFSLANAFRRGLHLLGAGGYTASDMMSALDAYWSSGAVSFVAGQYGFGQVGDAFRRLTDRATVGRVVVCP